MKQRITLFGFLLFLLLGANNITAGTYSGGDGSSGNPYQINTNADLIELSQTPGDWGAFFIQTADISFNADETLVDWDGDTNPDGSGTSGVLPIGNDPNYFTGDYDGGGYTISNIFIDRNNDHIGLFGYAYTAEISNIGVVDCNVSGAEIVGGLVGYLYSSSLSNSYSTGSVTGTTSIGGLMGILYNSPLNNSYSTANVSGIASVGGLVAEVLTATVNNSYSRGDVIRLSGNDDDFAGFCAQASDATIQYCYSTGSVIYDVGSEPTDQGFARYAYSSPTFTSNFFDAEASNQNTDGAGAATPKTTAEMKDSDTFFTAGWDFVGESDNGTDDIWIINTINNDGYPYHSWDEQTPQPVTNITQDKQYTTLQDAIDDANPGDHIVTTEFAGDNLHVDKELTIEYDFTGQDD